MVDINLFEDDDEPKNENQENKEEEAWDSLSDEGEGLDSTLDDDLGFGEETKDKDNLDEESLLDEDEAIPDFEEADEKEDFDDYEVGEIRKRKTPILLWIVLAIVVIFAAVYFFILEGGRKPARRPPQITKKPTPAMTNLKKPDSTKTSQGVITSSVTPKKTVSDISVRSIDISNKILNDLSGKGQFVGAIIEEDRFSVEYASKTPGASDVMGKRLESLLGVTGYKASPEDSHKTLGNVYYYGVISGTLPPISDSPTAAGLERFKSIQQFTDLIQAQIKQNGLDQRGLRQKAPMIVQGVERSAVEVILEGEKEKVLGFLEALKTIKGQWGLDKLTLSQSQISDFNAKELKIFIMFWAVVEK